MIHLTPDQLHLVQGILQKHVPHLEVRAFGSRVIGNLKPHSDLDLALMTEKKLSLGEFAHLKESFEESDLPFRVDILDWSAIDADFRKIIEERYEIIQQI